jgi:hypothetical protein
MNYLEFSNADGSVTITQEGYDFRITTKGWVLDIHELGYNATLYVTQPDGTVKQLLEASKDG